VHHVRAQEAGVLVEVVGEVDEIVEVGSPLFRTDTDADAPEGTPPEPAPVKVASEVVGIPVVPTAAAAAPPPPRKE
jgi:2-oxoglutarate dehydrogenase E2 component (dihydrolipoamide succinyltransferase)